MARIAIGGMQHETNTFAPSKADYAAFEAGGGPMIQGFRMNLGSVHFRADFEPIAKQVLVVKSPGPALADPAEFKWLRLRKGLRPRPLGPVYQG